MFYSVIVIFIKPGVYAMKRLIAYLLLVLFTGGPALLGSNYIDILRFDISRFPQVRVICLPYSEGAGPSLYLKSDNYSIIENGLFMPTQLRVSPIVNRLSYNYILVVDNSGSVRRFHEQIRNSIDIIINSMEQNDRASLFLFDRHAIKITDLDADKSTILEKSMDIRFDGRVTYIYDSLFEVANYLVSNRADMNIIIFFTDGIDTGSMVQPNTVIEKLTSENIKFMNIGFGNHRGLAQMERISTLTGFRSFRMDIARDMQKLGEYLPYRMNNQMVVSFASAIESIPDNEYFVSLRFRSNSVTALSSFSTRNIIPISNYILSLSREKETESILYVPQLYTIRPLYLFSVLLFILCCILIVSVFLLRKKTADKKRMGPFDKVSQYHEESEGDIDEEHEEEHTQLLEDIPDLSEDDLEEEEFDDEILSKTVVMSEEPVIIIKQGSSRKITYDLAGNETFTIGRAEGNSIVLANRSVSSKHCIIRKMGGVFVIYDLKSTNGTFVNGQKITKAMLKPGDTIHIGETILDFQLRRR